MGARDWADPADSRAVEAIFEEIRSGDFNRNDGEIDGSSLVQPPRQPAMVMDAGEPFGSGKDEVNTVPEQNNPAEELFSDVRRHILKLLAEPKSRDEVTAELGVIKRQAEVWLKRLVDDGAVRKLSNPVRYVAVD